MKNIAYTIFVVFLMASCSGAKHTTETTQTKDSVRIETRVVVDTTRVTITDTIRERADRAESDRTTITLSGGQYDTHSGVISGITQIDMSKELREAIEKSQIRTEDYLRVAAQRDSIAEELREVRKQRDEAKEARGKGFGYNFFLWYFLITAGIGVVAFFWKSIVFVARNAEIYD